MFAPTRRDYLDLLTRVPLPAADLAFDVGTGTGVLAAVLAGAGSRGWWRPTARPVRSRAPGTTSTGWWPGAQVEVEQRDLFPSGGADIVVANPPSLPGADLDRGVLDPGAGVSARTCDRAGRGG